MPTLTAALDSISEGLIVLDREWRFVFANPAAERFMRKTAAEVMGRSLWEMFPDAASRRFGVEYRRAVADGVLVEFEEYYPEPLNAWFEVRAYPSPGGLSIFFRDVTSRREVDEALRQSEERYRALFDRIGEGFALFEIDHTSSVPCDCRFLDVNPAFEALTGLRRDQVAGRLASEALPAGRVGWLDTCHAVAVTGESKRFDHYSTALDRHYKVFAYRPAPRQVAVLFHDVTEQQRLEEALRVNLAKYSALFESFPLGISVTDSEGRVREINSAASRLLAVPPETVLDQRVGAPEWRIIRPDGSPMPPEEFASVRAMREQRAIDDVETGIARPGEDVIWVSVSAAPIRLDGYGVVITYGDISRRRRAEAELADAHREAVAARARLEAAMEALPTGLAILDAGGGIVRANAAYDRLWGLNHPVPACVEGYRQFKARWIGTGRELEPGDWASARAVRSGEPVIGQLIEIDRFDGGRAFALNSAAPIFDERGAIAGCAVAIQDISRLVEAEAALVRSETALRALNADLETANAALQDSNATLEARVAERTAELSERTAQVKTLALDRTRVEEQERRRIARVLHDHLQQLLALGRINVDLALGEATTVTGERSLTTLRDLLEESLEVTRKLTAELSPAILHRGDLATALRWLGRWFEAQFRLKVDVEGPERVQADEEVRVALFRATRELLFNVVKHAHVVGARVEVNETADGRIRVVVRDEGVGFDARSAWGGSSASGSFGLLSLRNHLELLGGRIDVESSPGCGTSITLLGPAPRPTELEAAPARPRAGRPRAAGGARRTGVRRATGGTKR